MVSVGVCAVPVCHTTPLAEGLNHRGAIGLHNQAYPRSIGFGRPDRAATELRSTRLLSPCMLSLTPPLPLVAEAHKALLVLSTRNTRLPSLWR